MDIYFKTFPKQKQVLHTLYDNIHTQVGYGGGAGGAKSYTGVFWIWSMCQKYPGIRSFIGRKELKRLKQTTLVTYYEMLNDYNVPEAYRGVYNTQDSAITFQNGSEILLLDCAYQPSDPLYNRFGSLNMTIGFIDESAEVDKIAISILSTRVARWKNEKYGIIPKILETFNPDKGHVYERYWTPYKNNSMPFGRIFIPSLATDNPFLDGYYIDQLKKQDEKTKQRLLYGNFDYDDTPGRLIEYDKILDIKTNVGKSGNKYITCDPARFGQDKAIIRVWDGLNVIDKSIYDYCDATIIENKIREYATRYTVPMSNCIIDEDGMGGPIVDHLKCKGFVNNSKALNGENYRNLKTQCYFKLAEYINKGMIGDKTLDDHLIQELDVLVQVNMDKDGALEIISKDKIKEKIGRSPDESDSMMMRMWWELGEKKQRDLSILSYKAY